MLPDDSAEIGVLFFFNQGLPLGTPSIPFRIHSHHRNRCFDELTSSVVLLLDLKDLRAIIEA